MKRVFIAACAALAVAIFLPFAGLGQASNDNATLGLIDAFKQYKDLTPDSVSNLVHQIILGIAASSQPETLKEELFKVLGNGKLSAVIKVSSDADGEIFRLMRVTATSLPDNLTDDQLEKLVKKDGQPLQKKIQRIWTNKAVTPDLLNAFNSYPPTVATNLMGAVVRPWFTVRKKPFGASSTTWASISLQGVYADSGMAYMMQRSTAMKLIQWMGVLNVPTYAHADFQFSQQSSVIMQLPEAWWTTDDVPVLQTLVNDPVYGNAATEVLHSVFGN